MKRNNKKTKIFAFKNLFGGILLFLSSTYLISVGFSTWALRDSKDTSFNFVLDNVDANFDKFVFLKGPTFDFELCQDGMVKDFTIIKEGSLTFVCSFYTEIAKNYIWNDNSYHFTVTLNCTDAEFLTFISNKPSGDNLTVEDNNSTSSNKYVNKISINVSDVTLVNNMPSFSFSYSINDNNDNIKAYYDNVPKLSAIIVMEPKT